MAAVVMAAAFISLMSLAQEKPVLLNYPAGYRVVDMSESQNVAALNEIAARIKKAKEESKIYTIVCRGYSAPESDNAITRNIGRSRTEELAEQFVEKGLVRYRNVVFQFEGIGWNILRQQVERSEMPYRDEVLQILSRPDEIVMSNVHDNQALIVEGLKKIDNGRVWHEIKYTVIPVIRNTLYVTSSGGSKWSLRYNTGSNALNPTYDGNRRKTEEIAQALKEGQSITIAYSPNPGGDNGIYRNIAETRAKNLAASLIEKSGASRNKISYTMSNDGWQDLRSLIAQQKEPWSQEALDIIDNYREHLLRSSKSADDVKLNLLKKIDGGKVYESMKTTMFPLINNILLVEVRTE